MRAFRNVIFWLHLAGGCAAGVVILTMAATGVLLAFEHQITAWVDQPELIDTQPIAAPHAQIQQLVAALETSGRGAPTEIIVRNTTNAPVEARFGRQRTLYLNPWTGEVLGEPSEKLRHFFASIESIHRSMGLGMQNSLGRGITGASNFTFLFMVLSGLYLWFPKIFISVGFKSRLMFHSELKARAREWNWHHVVGIWSLIPLFFIVLTGVIMSYPWASNLLFSVTGSQPQAQNERGAPRGGAASQGGRREAYRGTGSATPQKADTVVANYKSIDELIAVAEEQTPSWKSITLSLPRPEDLTMNLSVDKSVGGQPEKAFQLVMNRQTGKIDSIRLFSANSTGRKLRAWARFLHTGEELGLIGQIIAALASLGAVVLVWTGISMALRRAFARFEFAHKDSEANEDEKQAMRA